jgi:hypothetical protein
MLINGDTKKHLQEQLGEDALKYIENAYGFITRAIQNNHPEDAEVILRDISGLRERAIPEPTQRASGFAHMLECAHGATQEPDPVERSQPINEFPEFCTKQCPHTQCSSWGTSAMENQPCRNRVPTNEQFKHAQTRTIDNDKLKNLLARLEIVETELRNAENVPKNEHIFPDRPNLCRPKNPNGLEET